MDIIQLHCLVSGIGAHDIGRGNEDKIKSIEGLNGRSLERPLYRKRGTNMPYGFWSFTGIMCSWQFNLPG
ncbi:hypothetical protein ES319_A10G254900v1 [Gossypium barbadense]|uniref:Uncharacterized protein n=2 Tax=Gossypium TaxID=3633 RepID=A0A5J5U8H2_GOSBA|nr:hypothetical protein ES319_A10G254900v1 [Gossypium barbadense]TYI08195.1 hypothetical protein ES332_A10G281900v1 [Gossypium tomentosum]